ncbi:hypothetical protein DP650_22340, partial [Salmonella enterica]|nr:hypothetical protein [Salmonella enterica]
GKPPKFCRLDYDSVSPSMMALQIELFPFSDKGVMVVQKDMQPGYGRHSSEKSKSPGVVVY